MTDTWPDLDCSYERPALSSDRAGRWQEAITGALIDSGTLRLTPVHKRVHLLEGACPRCGHHTQQEVTFDVIRGLAPGQRQRTHRLNFDCSCDVRHRGAGKDDRGCGWGGPLTVTIVRPS